MKILIGGALCATFLTASNLAWAAGSFTDFNLVVRQNLSSTSEVEGRTAIGGNLTGSASNYGVGLTPPAAFVATDVLIVGGSIQASNVNMNAGNLRIGGSISGNINHNGGGSTINDASASSTVASLGNQMLATSAALAAMSPNSVASLPGGQPAPALFNASPGPNGVAVFAISASSLFQNNLVQSIDINFNGASSVIINVTGGSTTWTDGNFVGNFNTAFARSHVLWNLSQSTSLDLGGRAFNGSLLAPNAAVTFQGVIEGSAWVKSMNQMGEVHLPNYGGFVPAPGSMGVLAIGGLLAAGRRRALRA